MKAAIRGHYTYQSKWTQKLNLKLKCAIDTRDEAVEHDESAIGVYLLGKEGRQTRLVGHLPIEISKLMKQFLGADKNSLPMTTVVGKTKREVGLVSPANYSAITTNQVINTVLNNELLKRKEKCKHFEIKLESVNNYKKKLYSTKRPILAMILYSNNRLGAAYSRGAFIYKIRIKEGRLFKRSANPRVPVMFSIFRRILIMLS